MTRALPATRSPRLSRAKGNLIDGWNQVGTQMRFYFTTLGATPDVLINYRSELLRLIAQMGMGTGALALIGGTAVIIGFMSLMTSVIVAAQGYNEFQSVSIEALTGFASAFFIPRLIVPGTAQVTLSATIGAGATAQMGAMRINEEIDALEVIGIRSISYLAAARLIAGTVVTVPLYAVALMAGFFAARLGTTAYYGQPTGVFDHYFNTFLNPIDLMWSFVQTIVEVVAVMLVCTYYGFTASGGPAGVGEAVGRAVRASLVVGSVILMAVTLAIYGHNANFHLAS